MRISDSLRRHGHAGRTICLKIKFADFSVITRSHTGQDNVDSAEAIYTTACDLLAAEPLPQPVRLIGISVSGFDIRSVRLFLPGINWQNGTAKRPKPNSDYFRG